MSQFRSMKKLKMAVTGGRAGPGGDRDFAPGAKACVAPGEPEPVQPASGGIYTEALVGSFGRLNPLLDAYNLPDHDINRLIFSSLVEFDDRGVPQPDLANSWGVSKDGKIYNF